MPGRDRARDRSDVDEVGRSTRLERGQERPQAPDRAEIVRPHELLDLIRLEVEETAAARNAGVVDQQADRRVPFAHRRGDALDFGTVGDVADLLLRAELAGDLGQPLLAAGQQRSCQPRPRERARDRGADPARAAGDDGDLWDYRQTLTLRRACTERPRDCRTTRSLCGPRFAAPVRQFAP